MSTHADIPHIGQSVSHTHATSQESQITLGITGMCGVCGLMMESHALNNMPVQF